MGCPECEPGDVEVRGPGDAECTLCGGGFVSLPRFLTALAMERADLERRPAGGPACPTCGAPFRALAVGGEPFHACLECDAVWAQPGALDRAESMVVRARAAKAASSPSTPSAPRPSLAKPAASSAPAPTPAPKAAPTAKPAPAATPAAAPRRPAALGRGPRAAGTGEAAALLEGIHAAGRAPPWRLLGAAVLVVVVAAVAWQFRTPAPAAVGGGRTARLATRSPERDIARVGGADVEVTRADRHGRRLEVAYAATGAREPGVAALVKALYGASAAVDAVSPLVEGGAARVGLVEAWVDGDEAWLLSASASDDGSFASSPDAAAFFASLDPVGRAKRFTPPPPPPPKPDAPPPPRPPAQDEEPGPPPRVARPPAAHRHR